MISNTKPVLVFQQTYCMQDDGVVPRQSGIGSTDGRFIPWKGIKVFLASENLVPELKPYLYQR